MFTKTIFTWSIFTKTIGMPVWLAGYQWFLVSLNVEDG